MLVLLFVVFNGFLVVSMAAPPAEHNGRTFRNALNQQSLQTILQSIEERLRNLDQIYSVRYTAPNINPNTNQDQYIRKIELLETKLSRMESQISGQLDQISQNMNSKTFKDDIAKDQLFRKIDSIYEKINHKLGYVEGKLDMDILKLQSKLEAGISKIERLDHSFSVRQADMEAEVSEAVEMMENVKNNVASIENKLMNFTKKVEITLNKQTNLLHTKFDNDTNLIIKIDKKLNISLEQCHQKEYLSDYANKDNHLTKTIKGYEDQIQTYGNKVNNMYSELWKKSNAIENSIKNSVQLMNETREELQDIKNAGNKFTSYQNDGQFEIIVDTLTNTIQRKFAELGRKLETNFENVMLVQNLFLESCHRIQVDETQLENKISLVLEKLLDAVTNRSINTVKEIQSVEELIKSHDTNVYRTVNQNTNTIIKLSEKTSEDRKKLEKILSTVKKDIGDALETIKKELSTEDQKTNLKYDTVASILLELQEQVNDLDNRMYADHINDNAQQILQDILLATKSLPNKDTFPEKFNSTLLHNVQDLSELMTRIYHLLTSIYTKINKSYLDYQLGVNNNLVNEEFHEDIINNNTKDQANITNFSREENGKIYLTDEVTEPVDVVLKIPERNHKRAKIHTLLSRFNYTLVNDNMPDYYDEINEYIPETTTKEPNESIDKTYTAQLSSYYEDARISITGNYNSDDSRVFISGPKENDDSDHNNDAPTSTTEVLTTENIRTKYKKIREKLKNRKDEDSEIVRPTNVPITTEISTTEENKITNAQIQEENKGFNPLYWIGKYFLATNEETTPIEIVTDKSAYFVTDTSVDNKNDTNSAPKYSHDNKGSTSKKENKNENNAYMEVSQENNHYLDVSIGYYTLPDIPVSDTTIKSEKIESATPKMFDEETFDEITERTTHNSFEYPDLNNNNTNDENIRDEYEWDYEE